MRQSTLCLGGGSFMKVVVLGISQLLFLFVDVCVADFTSCGGFVKPSPQLARSIGTGETVDFSHITVNLKTLDGVLKDSTACGPHGYYLIPIYDAGAYYLSVDGPQGWTFDTKVHRVEIEKDKPCNNDEDLDFTVVGFSLSGWITGEDGPTCPGHRPSKNTEDGGRNGPAGVLVQISTESTSSSPDTDFEPRTTMTGEGGLYVFPQILPGRYILSASHPTWSIFPQQITTSLGLQNKEVEEDFKVSGYDVRARVISSGGEDPISGVEFCLHTFDSSVSSGIGDLFAKARSDDGGRAVFTNIPRGCFILVPSFAEQATFFEFQPTSLQVEVGHGSVVIDNPFQVVGFTVYGRVTHENGDPIQGVSILVGNEVSATTDADGFYKIEKMTTGMFDIVARKDHFYFGNLLKHHVTANDPALPDITADGYDLCGSVHLISESSIVPNSRAFSLQVKSGKDFSKVFSSKPLSEDQTAKTRFFPYCVRVPLSDSDYSVSVALSEQDKQKGLMFVKEEQTVHLSNSPILGIDFTQYLPTLSGKVDCLKPSCSSVTVFLVGANPTRETQVGADGSYSFDNVVPGKYSVVVSPSRNVDDKLWCWNKKSRDISVGRSNVNGVDFSHQGYAVSVLSSVPEGRVLAQLEGENEKEREFVIKKGDNFFCVEEDGTYTLKVTGNYKLPKPVYFFGVGSKQDGREYLSILNGLPTLLFNPVASLLKGEIRAEIPGADKNFKASVNVKLVASAEEHSVDALFMRKEGSTSIFGYQFWNPKANREAVLTPKISDSRVLLYPSSSTVQIKKELDSNVEISQFSAREGVFIEGTISELGGVEIEILDQKTKEVITTVTTDHEGKYHCGPLYDNREYESQASKAGYQIQRKEGSKYDFMAKRLASVNVHVVDSMTELTLDGVLLSLSGMSYRSNNMTNAHGTLEFLNLSPGPYFLKPMLKEYLFEPPQLSLEIQEGAQKNVTISAVRIEYSCFGKVTSLNRQPLKRVVVEARSEDDYEETQTDEKGEYRIRGLIPGQSYTMSLKQGGRGEKEAGLQYNVRTSVPSEVVVEGKKEDLRGVDFIGFGESKYGTVAGRINIEEQYLSSTKTELFQSKGSGLQLVKEVPIHAVNYFEISNLPLGSYVLKMSSNLPKTQFHFTDVKKNIVLEKGDEVVSVELEMEIGLIDDYTESTVLPYPLLFVLIALGACAWNYKKVSAFLQDPRGAMEEKKLELSSFLPHHVQTFNKKPKRKTK